jgi:hypothetical protein
MTRLLFAGLLLTAAAAAPYAQSRTERFVVIGCVSAAPGSKPPAFLITDTRRTPPQVYRLDADSKQLSWLVGQSVEVAGAITPAAGTQPPSLKVSSVTRISTTCIKRTP